MAATKPVRKTAAKPAKKATSKRKPSVARKGNVVTPTVWGPAARTDELAKSLGGVTALARALGVSPSQPSRWRSGKKQPGPEAARRLIDLDHVVARALLVWDPEVVPIWLRSANGHLNGQTPLGVLATRGPSEVLDALDALESGGLRVVRVYRVFPYLPSAEAGEPGHPSYLPTVQGGGRLDNPGAYVVRYFAETAAGAVAERFGELDVWLPSMFGQPKSGVRLALASFEMKASVRVLELDDAQALVDRELRPTQVVRRDHATTQAWALRIHEERSSARGPRRWDGVRWWSWYRPEWPVIGLWSGPAEVVGVQPLGLDHPAVREAATALGRPLGERRSGA